MMRHGRRYFVISPGSIPLNIKVSRDVVFTLQKKLFILTVVRGYIRCEMTPTSVGGEQQISISGGVNLPSDIASGRAHIVRWTMVLRRPKRSVECSDSEKNMSAFADQNHAPSLTCVRLERIDTGIKSDIGMNED